MSTHKAYRLHSYGGPECLQLDDAPIPVPGPTQVLIAVSTVALNPLDWKVREGYVREAFPLPLPATLGVDFVGTVVSNGDKASRFKPGDRVMTFSEALGAFAEHIVVDEKILARVPNGLSDVEATTLPIPALTAWQALQETAGPLKPGMNVLIHGASGVVGAFAIQFAKAAGATVIGTASAKNKDFVLGLGADKFIDYQTEKFEDLVSNIDFILDCVLLGGDRNTTDRSWGILKPNGAIVTVADPAILGKIPAGFRGFFPHIEPKADRLEILAKQLEAGELKSKVAKVFGRGELIEAMEINKAGGTTGRLIVDFRKI